MNPSRNQWLQPAPERFEGEEPDESAAAGEALLDADDGDRELDADARPDELLDDDEDALPFEYSRYDGPEITPRARLIRRVLTGAGLLLAAAVGIAPTLWFFLYSPYAEEPPSLEQPVTGPVATGPAGAAPASDLPAADPASPVQRHPAARAPELASASAPRAAPSAQTAGPVPAGAFDELFAPGPGSPLLQVEAGGNAPAAPAVSSAPAKAVPTASSRPVAVPSAPLVLAAGVSAAPAGNAISPELPGAPGGVALPLARPLGSLDRAVPWTPSDRPEAPGLQKAETPGEVPAMAALTPGPTLMPLAAVLAARVPELPQMRVPGVLRLTEPARDISTGGTLPFAVHLANADGVVVPAVLMASSAGPSPASRGVEPGVQPLELQPFAALYQVNPSATSAGRPDLASRADLIPAAGLFLEEGAPVQVTRASISYVSDPAGVLPALDGASPAFEEPAQGVSARLGRPSAARMERAEEAGSAPPATALAITAAARLPLVPGSAVVMGEAADPVPRVVPANAPVIASIPAEAVPMTPGSAAAASQPALPGAVPPPAPLAPDPLDAPGLAALSVPTETVETPPASRVLAVSPNAPPEARLPRPRPTNVVVAVPSAEPEAKPAVEPQKAPPRQRAAAPVKKREARAPAAPPAAAPARRRARAEKPAPVREAVRAKPPAAQEAVRSVRPAGPSLPASLLPTRPPKANSN